MCMAHYIQWNGSCDGREGSLHSRKQGSMNIGRGLEALSGPALYGPVIYLPPLFMVLGFISEVLDTG